MMNLNQKQKPTQWAGVVSGKFMFRRLENGREQLVLTIFDDFKSQDIVLASQQELQALLLALRQGRTRLEVADVHVRTFSKAARAVDLSTLEAVHPKCDCKPESDY